MMRVFRAYRVGHAADGSPLTPPARLWKPGDEFIEQQRASVAEGMQP
jgi:hypothetical protein